MKRRLTCSAIALFCGVALSAAAGAQLPDCGDLIWTETALAADSNVADHCLEVTKKNGQTVARLHARVVRQGSNFTVIQWQLPDGSWSDTDRRYPDRDFVADMGGEDVKVSALPPRAEVNVYVSEGMYFRLPAPAPKPAAAPAPAPVVAKPAPAPAPEAAPVVLPSTATQLPLVALFGGLFVLLGAALSFARSRLSS